MENYDEHDKNYGALVNSVSVAMVDKARGILMDLPKTMPRLQYKSQTSGLMCYPVEEALQAWSLSVDDDKLLLRWQQSHLWQTTLTKLAVACL